MSLSIASAIECYNCESVSEPNCGEDFNMEEYFKIDCDQVAPPRYLNHDLESFNATACMKKIYKGEYIKKKNSIINAATYIHIQGSAN